MPSVLIIGAGTGIGKASAETFTAAGYKVAVASRTQKLDPKYPYYAFDASKPETVPALFEKVSADIGVLSVVIYIAAAGHISLPGNPFDVELDEFNKTMNVNATTPYYAAREAVKGFEKLGPSGLGSTGGTFLFVGNGLNTIALPGFMTFAMQKGATAHLIQHLALAEYDGKPYKFYYLDERHADGTYVTKDLSGAGHAEEFLKLVNDSKQGPWDYTFVSGKGYAKFPPVEFMPWRP
ncbi:NAD(P)-binding protein [Daldinia sp. FL1419]|nr:NAD(P)-binding protein [Daldinia sp. FL1419]